MLKNHLIKKSTNFFIKTLREEEIEGAYLNIIKAMYEKPTANIILIG